MSSLIWLALQRGAKASTAGEGRQRRHAPGRRHAAVLRPYQQRPCSEPCHPEAPPQHRHLQGDTPTSPEHLANLPYDSELEQPGVALMVTGHQVQLYPADCVVMGNGCLLSRLLHGESLNCQLKQCMHMDTGGAVLAGGRPAPVGGGDNTAVRVPHGQ